MSTKLVKYKIEPMFLTNEFQQRADASAIELYIAEDVERVFIEILVPFVRIIEAKAISEMTYSVPEEQQSEAMILECMPSGLVEPFKKAQRLLAQLGEEP